MGDGAVEDILVPRRQQHARPRPCRLTGAHPLARLELDREWLVVRTPHGDARVVPEQVHHLARLAVRLLPGTTPVAPLEREVLPEEQSRRVGRVVQLGARDVRVQPEQVEVRVLREGDVVRELVRARLGERHAGRTLVGAHHEDRFAVHPPLPVPDLDVAEGRGQAPIVAADAVDLHPDLDVDARLAPEAPGPPARGPVHEEGHGQGRPPARGLDGHRGLGESRPLLVGHVRDEDDVVTWRRAPGIERHVEPELAAHVVRLGAEHAQPRDAHGAGVAQADRPPDPARVPFGVEVVPVGEHPRDHALRGPVGLAR